MNKNLQQIFDHYTEKFSVINDADHNENFKWKVAKEFRERMDFAFTREGNEFADALYRAKMSTENIIDSFTQPFQGLVVFARQEPETVKKMFQDLLLTDDGGDLTVQERLIADFFRKSEELLAKYAPDSFRFKQNSHSVSAYLFLYEPETHYMFKATQARRFADCVAFYDDWGSGSQIKLDPFYRMCDEVAAAVLKDENLLAVNESRYSGEFGVSRDRMIEDRNKHMLVFDLIYCCDVYGLYDGIRFSRTRSKERHEFEANREKAKKVYEHYQVTEKNYTVLKEALSLFMEKLSVGTAVRHAKFGKGKVTDIDSEYVTVLFDSGEEKRLALTIVIGKKLLKADYDGFQEDIAKYAVVLKKKNALTVAFESARQELEKYENYLV